MSKRILVVEDQPDSRQIIRDMLAPTDYEITEAENGEEALAAITKQRPDLILMDVQMPIMDGYTATRRIKGDAALRSIPIIAVTSYALSDEEKKARAAGCDDYVPTIHDRHLNIHQDEIGPLLCNSRERLLAVFSLGDLIVGRRKHVANDLATIRLILDDQNMLAHAVPICRSTMTGRVNAKVDPWPGCDSTQIRPPCISMMRLDMASPKPVPPFLRVMALSACWNS